MSFFTGFALPKNSLLTWDVEVAVGRLRDAGLTAKWHHLVYYNFTVMGKAWMASQRGSDVYNNLWTQVEEQGGGVQSFGVENVIGAFLVLISGCLISCMAMAMEALRKKQYPFRKADGNGSFMN